MTGPAPLPDRTESGVAGSVLSNDAPHVDGAEAAAIMKAFYGLDGRLEALPSERDHNFRVVTERGAFVLKLTHPGEPRAVTRFQTMALRHIAAVDPGLAVPAVVATLGGEDEPEWMDAAGAVRIVRLLTYLPGRLLIQVTRSAAQDQALGAFLARLGRSLRGFFHPAAGDGDLLWDLRQLPRVAGFAAQIADPQRRMLVERALADALARALPVLPQLRAQVVHNDLNPSNVVVDPSEADHIAGVLDFGDMLHGPLVCDVAVGACYRWTDGEHPLAGVARFVAGYHRVTPLEDSEVAILFDLVRARLALTVAIVNWQAERYPGKRAYVMRLNAELWRFLGQLDTVPREAAHALFRRAIGRGDSHGA